MIEPPVSSPQLNPQGQASALPLAGPSGNWYTAVHFLSSIAGIALALVATSTYGPGISTDAVHYLSAAESLSQGKGLFDFFGQPFLRWPPLYPAVLAGLKLATGGELLQIARVLNATLFGISILLGGILIRRSIQDRSLALTEATVGTLAILFSLPMLSLAANVLADPAFIALVLLFFFAARAFLTKPAIGSSVGMVLIACGASLVRWNGLALIVAGAALVLYAFRNHRAKAILWALTFCVISSLPLLLWLVVRNVGQYHSLFGTRTFDIDQLVNMTTSLRRVANWVLPRSRTDTIPIGVVVGLPLAFLLLTNSRANWLGFYRRLLTPSHLPILAFLLSYLALIWLAVQTREVVSVHDDRAHAPLYLPLVVLSILVIEELIAPHRVLQRINLKLLLIPAMFLWLIYPISRVVRFTGSSIEHGVISYNLYNTDRYHTSGFLLELRAYSLGLDDVVYSNYPAVVYFFTGHLSLASPVSPTRALQTQAFLLDRYSDWPASGQAYLAWFRLDPLEKDLYFGPGELEALARLEKQFDHPDGAFYRVTESP